MPIKNLDLFHYILSLCNSVLIFLCIATHTGLCFQNSEFNILVKIGHSPSFLFSDSKLKSLKFIQKVNSPVIPEPVIFCWYLNGRFGDVLHDLTFTTLTLGILVITILTVTISFTIPKPLCEHYIMGPFFLILQSLIIPYLQPHQLPVSKSILLLTIMFYQ